MDLEVQGYKHLFCMDNLIHRPVAMDGGFNLRRPDFGRIVG